MKEVKEKILYQKLNLGDLITFRDELPKNIKEEVCSEINQKALKEIEKVFNCFGLRYQVIREDNEIIGMHIERKELSKMNPGDLTNETLAIMAGCRFFGLDWSEGKEELSRRNLLDKNNEIRSETKLRNYYNSTE